MLTANARAENRIERMRAACTPARAKDPSAKPNDILLDVLSGDLRHKESILADVRNELLSIEAENNRLSKENDELTAAVSNGTDLNEELDSALRRLSSEVTAMQRRLTQAHKSNTDLHSHRLALNQIRSQTEALQREETELRRHHGVRVQQEETQRVGGLMDSIRDVMTRATRETFDRPPGAPIPPSSGGAFERLSGSAMVMGGLDGYTYSYSPSSGTAPPLPAADFPTPQRNGPPARLFSSPDLERSVRELLDGGPTPDHLRSPAEGHDAPRPPSASPPPGHASEITAFHGDAEVPPDLYAAHAAIMYEFQALSNDGAVWAALPALEDLLHRVRILKLQI